jgi:hypothetical protein
MRRWRPALLGLPGSCRMLLGLHFRHVMTDRAADHSTRHTMVLRRNDGAGSPAGDMALGESALCAEQNRRDPGEHNKRFPHEILHRAPYARNRNLALQSQRSCTVTEMQMS